MIFSSTRPAIEIPTNIPIWDFLFNSDHSPHHPSPSYQPGAFINAETGEQIRYDEVKSHATSISTTLVRKYGLQKGDTVAILSTNTIWYPVGVLAAVRAGAMICSAWRTYNIDEMTHALRTTHAKMIMTLPSLLGVAIPAAKNAGIPPEHIFLLENECTPSSCGSGHTSLKDLLAMGKEYPPEDPFHIPPGQSNRDICAFLVFSSGTTGPPKIVRISHHNVLAQCLQLKPTIPPTLKDSLAALSFCHITGLIQIHTVIQFNTPLHVLPKFTIKALLKTVTAHKITDIVLVPALLARLLQDPVARGYDLAHVERIGFGVAPLADPILQALVARYPHISFRQGYGMTEACGIVTRYEFWEVGIEEARRAGRVLSNMEIRILGVGDGDGGEKGVDEVGEIVVRGPQVAMGYLGDEGATGEVFGGGWLRTGDLGLMDAEGFLVVKGRIKEMVVVEGGVVWPAEVEGFVLEVQGVIDAAVGEVDGGLKAYVVGGEVAREKRVALGREIIEHVRARTVRCKWVVAVEFVDEIPRNSAFKIVRGKLRETEVERPGRVVVRE